MAGTTAAPASATAAPPSPPASSLHSLAVTGTTALSSALGGGTVAAGPLLAQQQLHQQQHQQLVQILLSDAGIDEQLGSTLKTFFRAGKQGAFIDQLGVVVARKEQEIERLCNHHYAEFVASVDQLLHVRADESTLKGKLADFYEDARGSADRVLEKKRELVAYRSIVQNMDTALENNRACVFVLELVQKANLLIDGKKYYSALRVFKGSCLPAIRRSVKNAVLLQLKDWLVVVREQSRIVGELAMEQVTRRAGADPQSAVGAAVDKRRQRHVSLRSAHSSQSMLPIEMVMHEENEIDLVNNDRVKVDFRPLYQCLHIHDVMGQKASFRAHYEENRKLQANLVLSAPFSLSEADVSGFEAYLQDIIGFFIVEHQIVNTTDGFRSRTNVDSLWDVATGKLHQVISGSLRDCQNPDHFLRIKELMITFIQTMETYSYSVVRLIEVVMTFFERYSDLMRDQAAKRCLEAVQADEGNPLTVHSIVDYRHTMEIFKYQEDGATHATAGAPASVKTERLHFPITFPFSSSFIECCDETVQFIEGFYRFGEGFHQQFAQMDAILKSGVQLLITHHICGSLEAKLISNNIQLSVITRIILNLEFLDQAVGQFEELILHHRTSHRTVSPRNADMKADRDKQMSTTLRTACAPFFRDTRKKAEHRLFEVVNRKIDDFLDCAAYEFAPVDSRSMSPVKTKVPNQTSPGTGSGDVSEVSPFLLDLVAFLTTVWTSTLAELPVSIKAFVYYDAIHHISSALLAQLLDPAVRKLSPQFIEGTLQPDIHYLEEFVKGLGDDNLLDQLAEIKQAIALLHVDTPLEEYLNPTTKSRKYSRLPKQTVLILLEKLRESGAYAETSGGFWRRGSTAVTGSAADGGKKVDKAAKRKTLDMVIRALADEVGKK